MAGRSFKVDSLLALVQELARREKTNPYQIAKATGLPLRSVQKLLSQATNPTLRNVETILGGFGLAIHVLPGGPVSIQPGRRTQRGPRKVAT